MYKKDTLNILYYPCKYWLTTAQEGGWGPCLYTLPDVVHKADFPSRGKVEEEYKALHAWYDDWSGMVIRIQFMISLSPYGKHVG